MSLTKIDKLLDLIEKTKKLKKLKKVKYFDWKNIINKPTLYTPEDHEHDYASKEHTHDLTHTHKEYSLTNHKHNYIDPDGLINKLKMYSKLGHKHQIQKHEHSQYLLKEDVNFASNDHIHKQYAYKTHNHVDYSPLLHRHTQYLLKSDYNDEQVKQNKVIIGAVEKLSEKIKNKKLKIEKNLNLKNNKIINLADPTEEQDAVNLRTVEAYMRKAVGLASYGGVGNFLELHDTPDSYVGQASRVVSVRADETGLEFTAPLTTDEEVKVSANDTTAGYLNGKLVAGTGITLTENNDGGNETLTIASSITQYTDEMAQDAIGTILLDSATIDFTYDDATPTISAIIKTDSINDTHIDWGTGVNQVSAEDVPIADAGGYYTSTNVEGALQEVGAGLWLVPPVEEHWDITGGLPVDPDVGDRYISDGTDEGLGWYDGYIYEWDGTDWVETVPFEGMMVWLLFELVFWVFFSGGWMEIGEGSYLRLDGSNANSNIDISSYNFTTTGTIQGEHLKTTDDLEVADDILMASGGVINWDSGNATITHSAGILTFNVFPVTPSAAPDADYEVANKKYVDDLIGTVNSWAEVLALGNTSGGTNVIVSVGDILTTDTINETGAGTGVTIETILLKDKSIGATADRVTKGWFTDLEVTNAIAGSITGNAGTVTNATFTTALTVNTGTVTLTGNAANNSVLTIGAGAVGVSGTNTGDQTDISDFTGTKAEFDAACTDGNFAFATGAFHDGFSDFVANEHIDWTVSQAPTVIHADNYTNTTYTASDFNHDDLSNISGGGVGEYNHISDAELSVLQATSGSNTGDQDLSGLVAKSTFDAHTILYATTDDTPAALTVTEQTLVGRLTGGNISAVAIGIADNNIVQIDQIGVADNDFAKFTANGLEGRSYAETLSDIGAVGKAASSTDNAIPRFDGVDGNLLQNSTVVVSDTGAVLVYSTEVGKTDYRFTLSPADADALSIFGYQDDVGYQPLTVGAQGASGSNSNITFNSTVMNAKGDMTFETAAKISNGDTAPDCVNGGITLKSGSYDSKLITLKSADQTHGMTSILETDTYASMGTIGSSGGLLLRGLPESGDYGLYLIGYGVSEDTTLGTSGLGPVLISGRAKDGTSSKKLADGSNLVCVRNQSDTVAIIKGNGDIYAGDLRGMADNTYTLGSTKYRWKDGWIVNAWTVGSDRNCKNEIADEELGLSFIQKLKPKSYKWVDKEQDERKHGLMAQDVAEIIDPKDFAGVVHQFYTDEKTGEQKEYWGLKYTEFIAPLIRAVQEQQEIITKLTERIAKLEVINETK